MHKRLETKTSFAEGHELRASYILVRTTRHEAVGGGIRQGCSSMQGTSSTERLSLRSLFFIFFCGRAVAKSQSSSRRRRRRHHSKRGIQLALSCKKQICESKKMRRGPAMQQLVSVPCRHRRRRRRRRRFAVMHCDSRLPACQPGWRARLIFFSFRLVKLPAKWRCVGRTRTYFQTAAECKLDDCTSTYKVTCLGSRTFRRR